MTDIMECPKCGKKSLVQPKSDLFQCLVCDFKRDFSKCDEPKSAKEDFPLLLVVIVVALIALMMQPSRPADRPIHQPVGQNPDSLPQYDWYRQSRN